ncbi:MAG: hypothetical protein J0M28_04910 [Thauera sp.]|nr:hypothetical protein [Thauera sp.]
MNFRSPADCLNALQRIHPVDVDATQAMLSTMVAELLESMPPPNQHLEVLETARETLAFVQAEVGKRYAAQPLPPDGMENRTLQRVIALWDNLARSYALIARRDAEEGTLDDQRALLAQRRIHCAGMVLTEYFRAHREVPAGCWTEVHDGYAASVQAGLQGIRVADRLNEVWRAQSPHEAYVTVLLVDLANPYGRDQRELGWLLRWAQRFAPYSKLSGDVVDQRANVYGVDLGGDRGLGPIGLLPRTTGLMRFDGSALGEQIRAVLKQLKDGVKPGSLGLGEDCPRDACARLLLSLYRPWGQSSSGRRFPRRAMEGTIGLTGDWLAIGFGISGRVFEAPRTAGARADVREDISLLTFGERVSPSDDAATRKENHRHEAERLGLGCENWKLLDQSVGGFRIEQAPRAERLEHHQLVGVQPRDGDSMVLGQVSWLMFRTDGRLQAGIHLLSGVPRVIAVRPLMAEGRQPAYQQGFALPANPALRVSASLILPGSWYQRDRTLEMRESGGTRTLRMTQLLLRGANFDQVAFEPMPASQE